MLGQWIEHVTGTSLGGLKTGLSFFIFLDSSRLPPDDPAPRPPPGMCILTPMPKDDADAGSFLLALPLEIGVIVTPLFPRL